VDLEGAEAELECQRQDLAWQQDAQPPSNNNDAHTVVSGTMRFPQAAYNMAVAAYRLEDISDMPDLKTNLTA